MAIKTTLTSGPASAGGTWVGGIVPVFNVDSIVVDKVGTAVSALSTNTAGYAIGSVNIVLNAGGVAGSFAIGETVTFVTDINLYTVTNWVVGTNTLTITPLVVAIPAVATTVTNWGHCLTLDGAYDWGNDTASAINIKGRLRASRTVNSTLRVYGGITSTTTSYPNSVYMDRGSEADPIPSGVTSTLILNNSAVLGVNKYPINWQWGWKWTEWGAEKTEATRLVGAITAGAVSCVVDTATNWAIGDRLMLADTGSGAAFQGEYAIITSVAGTTIGFAATTFAHKDRGIVANVTRNVITKPQNSAQPCQLRMNMTSLGVQAVGMEDRDLFGWSHHEDMGVQGTQTDALFFDTRDQQFASAPVVRSVGFATYVTNFTGAGAIALGNISLFNTVGVYNPYYFSKTIICSTNNNAQTGRTGFRVEGSSIDIVDSWVLSGNTGTFNFFQVPYSSVTRGGSACGGGQFWVDRNTNLTFTDFNIGAHLNITMNGSYDFTTFINGNIGTGAGNGSISQSPPFNLTGSGSPATGYVFENTQLPVVSYTETQLASTQWLNGRSDALMKFNRPNGEDRYEWKRKNGTMYSENSIISRSNRAIKFAQSSNFGAEGLYYPFPIPMVAGVAVTVTGRLRKDAGYGGTNMPTATLSGQGSTPSTFTMTNSVDTYEKFSLTVTPTTTGFGTLKVQGKSNNGTTATPVVFYCDGVTFSPFNSYSRHYGYLYDTNPYNTVDPVISVSNEATVSAYAGISATYSAGVWTITVSGTATDRQLYDYQKYLEAINPLRNISISSTDGVNFTSTSNYVVTGTITKTSTNSNLVTTGTATFSGGGTSSMIFVASNGTSGYIAITGLSAHTVYVADNSLAQLDYQASVTGTYNLFIPPATTGSWTYVVKKAGYTFQRGTITASVGGLYTIAANTPQKFNADGRAMYTGSTSAFCSVSFATTTQANLLIGNGTVTAQQIFDTAEASLITNNGMKWLAVNAETSIFLSYGGNYFFMTTKWRLKRNLVGDVNATVGAFVQSADGTVVDGTNGGVQFLTAGSLSGATIIDAKKKTISLII